MISFSRIVLGFALLGATALGVGGGYVLRPKPEPLSPPLIAIEKMGQIVSVKVNYADALEFAANRTLGIPWSQWELRYGGTKVLLVARGDCTVATDLRAAKYEGTDSSARNVVVVLPHPGTLQARVNHDPREKGGSYFYAITNQGIEAILPDTSNRTQAINSALSRAQSEVARACTTPEVLATARANTEAILRTSFQAVGWVAAFKWQ